MSERNQTGVGSNFFETPDSVLWHLPIGLDPSQTEIVGFPLHQKQFSELAGLAESLEISLSELMQAIVGQFLDQPAFQGVAA